MIIDCILDRKEKEADLAMGVTHYRYPDGSIRPACYDPHDFYFDILRYLNGCGGQAAHDITAAMDYGEEEDVKRELCRYVVDYGYNPEICDYINSRNWLN